MRKNRYEQPPNKNNFVLHEDLDEEKQVTKTYSLMVLIPANPPDIMVFEIHI